MPVPIVVSEAMFLTLGSYALSFFAGMSVTWVWRWFWRRRARPLVGAVLRDLDHVRVTDLDDDTRARCLLEIRIKCNELYGPLKRAGLMPPTVFVAGDADVALEWIAFLEHVQREVS
ncbi:MAG: hypothetical protein F4Z25_06785 [Chloroflexi bacterium]|nr:hypothetical protein [Chloroflexota bacterium]